MTVHRLDADKPEFIRDFPWKVTARCATTANVTIATALNAGDSIDGVTLVAGDRVLVKDQSSGATNGLYVVGVTPVRSEHMCTGLDTLGSVIVVLEGTANGGKVFKNTNTGPITIDTTALTFAEFGAGSSGSTMPWFDVEDYGAVHDGTTDDTPAIQDAIDACFAAGGGTVFFPNGIYAIKGALTSTSTYNSQLQIPNNSDTSPNEPISIALVGMGPVAASNVSPTLGNLPSLSGAILLSDWNGTISGSPAVIAAGQIGALQTTSGWNWIFVTFRNIEIRTHADPKLSAIQMQAAAGLTCEHVTVSTNAAALGMSIPTHSNAVGIDMPLGLNANWGDRLADTFISGYYVGLRPSEQMQGDVGITHCRTGVRFTGNQGANQYLRHASHFDKLLLYSVPYGLVFDGDLRWVAIEHLLIEHDHAASGGFDTVYDIDDASNYARGWATFHTTDWATGPDNLIMRNGGAFFAFRSIDQLTQEILAAPSNPTTNPPSGRLLYADASTGHLSGRNSSGTVIDYEAGGAPSGSAGGDLSGTYPNPTVAKINGSALGTISPATGDRLRWTGSAWVNSALIWRPMTTYDPTSGLWVPLVDGDGNTIMAEA